MCLLRKTSNLSHQKVDMITVALTPHHGCGICLGSKWRPTAPPCGEERKINFIHAALLLPIYMYFKLYKYTIFVQEEVQKQSVMSLMLLLEMHFKNL